ncbi:hypothetical protein [Terriglobus albidus]|uniref:hypothetical protein n=1 Tax=Terriglobus albidus TaxID=1592106 RepID=UPI0021DFA560|nr:hypothetical protein [Terriglobus albidus]
MSTPIIFAVQSVMSYLAWLLCFNTYVLPKLKLMDRIAAQRAIATLHSFRFIGLVVMVPGIVGDHLPLSLASVAGSWDLVSGLLAIFVLITVRIRPLFWFFVVTFNLVGILDLILTYYHAVRVNLPSIAGQMGAAYAIPILFVPLLTITHVAAVYLMLLPQRAMALSDDGLTIAS